jgi:hypothetical protein
MVLLASHEVSLKFEQGKENLNNYGGDSIFHTHLSILIRDKQFVKIWGV